MIRLEEILTSEMIKFDVEAVDWEDAVRKSGDILYFAGKITKEYIEDMINIVKEVGPYIVIAPGVAIAHARPDIAKVKETGISLIRLKNPVNFGNKQNDPVSLVFTLAAKNSDSHMEQLGKLAKLLMDKEILDKFFNASKEEVIKAINSDI